MRHNNLTRQVLRAADIQLFFGKGERMSYKMMQELKRHFGKAKHQPVTITEFCSYYGVTREEFTAAQKIQGRNI
jgi:hypothetical protein